MGEDGEDWQGVKTKLADIACREEKRKICPLASPRMPSQVKSNGTRGV